jgi:hypothetical protein
MPAWQKRSRGAAAHDLDGGAVVDGLDEGDDESVTGGGRTTMALSTRWCFRDVGVMAATVPSS